MLRSASGEYKFSNFRLLQTTTTPTCIDPIYQSLHSADPPICNQESTRAWFVLQAPSSTFRGQIPSKRCERHFHRSPRPSNSAWGGNPRAGVLAWLRESLGERDSSQSSLGYSSAKGNPSGPVYVSERLYCAGKKGGRGAEWNHAFGEALKCNRVFSPWTISDDWARGRSVFEVDVSFRSPAFLCADGVRCVMN
ncbi:MAG: hypothetical protein Q9175_004342 [Cornicularia normoerica]